MKDNFVAIKSWTSMLIEQHWEMKNIEWYKTNIAWYSRPIGSFTSRLDYINELRTKHCPEFFEFVDQLILLDLHLRRVPFSRQRIKGDFFNSFWQIPAPHHVMQHITYALEVDDAGVLTLLLLINLIGQAIIESNYPRHNMIVTFSIRRNGFIPFHNFIVQFFLTAFRDRITTINIVVEHWFHNLSLQHGTFIIIFSYSPCDAM